MRKLLFAFAMMITGAFAFAAGSPASALTAGPVTGMADVVKSDATVNNVTYGGHCWRHPWHWYCRRHHHHYRRHYYRRYW